MYVVFAILRYFPFWAIPLALVLADVGRHYRRKGRSSQWVYWAISGLLGLLTLLWFLFRGDIHSDAWVREVFS